VTAVLGQWQLRRAFRAARPAVIAWCVAVALLWGSAAGAAADRSAPLPHDMLAHAAGDWLWVAQVVVVKPPPPVGEPTEQTQVVARLNKPKQPWRLLSLLPGRAAALASRESQLAVLMADGTWMTVWADGTASGQPLPAKGQLRAIADDGETLWGLGLVHGGLVAADADANAQSLAATRPMAMRFGAPPVAPATSQAVTGGDPAARLVLFRQQAGRWATVAQLPAYVPSSSSDDLSVAIVAGNPTVAYAVAGQVRTIGWSADHGWADGPATPPDAGHPLAEFAVLAGAGGPVMWTTAGAEPGRLGTHPLTWPGDHPMTGLPAVALAGGYLRVVGPIGERVVEQRYDPTTAAPVGGPAEVVVPTDLAATPVVAWAQALLLASLMFTVGTSMFRQATPAAATAGADAPGDAATATDLSTVVPAPLLARGLAGAIDLLPVAGALVALLITAGRGGDVPPSMQWLLVGAVALYLAHTTAVEAVTARSAGKWVMGLRVATVDGDRPAVWQLVSRNLLRLVDPLVQLAMSPLRQRTADVLVGTVVVSVGGSATPTRPTSGG
jgi:uncharacterized RDD family membrane protein YckC